MAALLLLAGVGVAGLSYEAADRLVHPPRERDGVDPLDRGIAYEPADVLTQDGLRLAAWWMPAAADAPALGTVVFLHGYGASKSQSLSVAPFLHRAGYHVLAFDFRAHGDSEGSFTTIGLDEGADVRAALEWLARRPEVDAERVALFGWSMGAAAGLLAARDLPEVRALVADSSFASLENVVANNLASFTGLPAFPFTPATLWFASAMTGRSVGENAPERAASEIGRPLLLIQGSEDRIARPESDGASLARAAGAVAQLWLVPGASHVDARREAPVEYEARVLTFLAASLS